MNVDAGIDYRHRACEQVQAYYTPLGASADHALRETWRRSPTPRRRPAPCASSSARWRCGAPAGDLVRLRDPVRRSALADDYLELSTSSTP
ncbi:hypothetical protein [Massilia phosphatilytica]